MGRFGIAKEAGFYLKDLLIQFKQRAKDLEEREIGENRSSLPGISTFFVGEYETGKTMASEVLANELKLDLFRIGLTQVVNKYIGETEKNLKRIFDAAGDGGAILLFDEADALFGKRSEVKDNHDRFANIEVNYFLQCINSYPGLTILMTNSTSNIDKAFLGNVRFIVQFPFPGAKQRAQI
ncbi:MAG: ATP-binding protein [Mariniphaga sp.]